MKKNHLGMIVTMYPFHDNTLKKVDENIHTIRQEKTMKHFPHHPTKLSEGNRSFQ